MKKFIIVLFFSFLLPLNAEFLKKEVHFIVKHPFKTVHGKCKEVNIQEIEIDNNLTIKPFRITIPYLKMDTGNQNRDSHMLEVLGYPIYKEILVEINPVKIQENTTFEGWITIKGIRKPIKSIASIEKQNNLYIVKGKANIVLTEFQIERPSLLGLAVEDLVEVNYEFIYKH